MFPLTQQVPAYVSEGGDEDEDDGGEGHGGIVEISEVFRPLPTRTHPQMQLRMPAFHLIMPSS